MHRGVIASIALLLLCAAASARADAVPSRDCSHGSATVQPLAKIENSRDLGYDCLGVRVDDHANIVSVLFEKHEAAGDSPKGHSAPAPTVREFTPAEIGTARGVVLDGTPGHEAVRLRGSIAKDAPAAPLVVSYLHNGVLGEFRECDVALQRGEADRWRLVNAAHMPVSRVVVRTWGMPILGTVGIETLQGICLPGPPTSDG